MVERKTNPRTHVTQVQKAFEAELYHRLVRDDRTPPRHDPLKPAIIERVADRDQLGLENTRTAAQRNQDGFDFPENPDRTVAFEAWLQSKLDNDVFERMSATEVSRGAHWSGSHVRDASRQGVRHAHRELRRVGVSPDESSVAAILHAPVHEDVLRTAYIRAYDELDGITSGMATDISRTMSDALAEGVNPNETARRMADRVDVGMTRTRRIARTESSRAYNTHAAARYAEHGIQKVDILTSDPCTKCRALAAGAPYPIERARSLIPNSTHPNCVCSLKPVRN